MTISNTVPKSGFLKVVFPSTQIAVPETAPPSFISVDQGKTWIDAPVTESSDSYLVMRVDIEITGSF